MSGARRITPDTARGRAVTFRFDGRPIDAFEGENVAAALAAAGIVALRRAPVDHGARGAFCFMGVCQECVVALDGVRVEACRLRVRDGLEIEPVS